MFYYSDNRDAASSFKGDLSKADACKIYLNHFYQKLMLDFIAKSTNDFKEAAQARAELVICERKLTYWQRHENYVQEIVTRGIEALKRQWKA